MTIPALGGTCLRGAEVRTGNSAYQVENADAPGGSSCLTVDPSGTTFRVASTAYSASANGQNPQFNDFTGYLAIFTGCKYGACLEHNYPIQASLIHRELANWSFQFSSNGKYDAALDMFFNKAPVEEKVPTGGEVMIWLNHHNVNLGGPRLADATIGRTQWHVFSAYKKTPFGNWNRIAFERVVPTNSVTDLDIALFVQAAMKDGAISPAWYQQDLEAGFEIWNGGVGLTTSSFAAGEPNAGLTRAPAGPSLTATATPPMSNISSTTGVRSGRPGHVGGPRIRNNRLRVGNHHIEIVRS